MSSLSQFAFGKPAQFSQRSTLGPEQRPLLQDLVRSVQGNFGDVGNYYRNLLSEQGGDFQALAAPQLRQFQQQTVPGLAAQFAGLGSGATQSSGLRNSILQANTDLGERLAALRANLRSQGAQGLQGLASQGLGNFYQQTYTPRSSGFFESAGQGLGQALGALGTSYGGQGLSSLIPFLQSLLQNQNTGVEPTGE